MKPNVKAKLCLRLGTRDSLLARVQSQWVANQLTAAHGHLDIQLVPIQTEGDRNQQVSLHDLGENSVFTKALEQALLQNQVDFAVHSMKDVSIRRPEGISLAAIPPREDVRDVVIFAEGIEEQIQQGLPVFQVGTSSPRRATNLRTALKELIPGNPDIEIVPMRGNVPTRLSQPLNAVVLAAAGVERLWRDPSARTVMKPLLKNRRRMVMPLQLNPSAPGQGALCIECLREREDLLALLAGLNDEASAGNVQREREIFARWGGGCHLPMGVTVFDGITFTKGVSPDGFPVDEVSRLLPPLPKHLPRGSAFVSSTLRQKELVLAQDRVHGYRPFEETYASPQPSWTCIKEGWVVAGHARAVPADFQPERLWVGGLTSWRALAARGYWVEGCFDHLGEVRVMQVNNALSFLKQGKEQPWVRLTHGREAKKGLYSEVLATYELNPKPITSRLKTLISLSTYFYWTSFSAFEELSPYLPSSSYHACGMGKTSQMLQNVLQKKDSFLGTFMTVEEWIRWIKPLLI
jgi:hydroxymethylbilane synthase